MKKKKNEKESLFYTNITLDGRFITVGENNWDLRSRHKFDEVHIDMNVSILMKMKNLKK